MLTQDKCKQPVLETVIASLDEQPLALGTVAQAVIKLTSDDNVSLPRLSRAISADPGLSARIIRKANSAFYCSPAQITNVPSAIVRIGIPATRSLAITGSIQAMFRLGDDEGFEERLWRHSLATGIGSRIILQHTESGLVEEAFLSGLLHDIGKLVLLQRLPEVYTPVLREVEKTATGQLEVECARLGFTHADLGAMILDRWNFAPTQCVAVRFHHNPDETVTSDDGYRADQGTTLLAHAVCLANDLSKAIESESKSGWDSDLVYTPAAKYLDCSQEEILKISEDLKFHLGDELQVFGQL